MGRGACMTYRMRTDTLRFPQLDDLPPELLKMSLQTVPSPVEASGCSPQPDVDLPERLACQRHARELRLVPHHGDGTARRVQVRYLWTGKPGAPTVVIQGGISADRDVCASPAHPDSGWWQDLVGSGRAIDLDRYRVLAIDWLDAEDLGVDAVSTLDQADAVAALLDTLRIGRVQTWIGASYGAMVGLAFASRHGRRLGRLVAIAGAHRPHPLATAQRSVQREIIRLGLRTGEVDQALSLARQLAMTTYRGSAELALRFSGEAQFRDGRFRLPVEDWLEHVGEQFVGRFHARRYLALSESIDLHAVDPATVRVPVTLIGFASDRLVPLSQLCALQRALGEPAELEVIETPCGHDGFLKETVQLAPVLRASLHGSNGD